MGDIDYSSMADNGYRQLLSFAQGVDPSAIEALANSWNQLSHDIPEAYQGFKTTLNSVFGSEWTGESADAARDASDRLCAGMNNNIDRVRTVCDKIKALAAHAHQVKSVADWAQEEANKKGLKAQDYQDIGKALADALQAFYGPVGEHPLRNLPAFEKVAPLVFAKPDEAMGDADDEKKAKGESSSDEGKGDGKGEGEGGGQGSGGGSGSGSGGGEGSGGSPSGSGSPAGAGMSPADLGSTDPMSSELAPMDPANARGGIGGGMGGGGIGGMGDKDRKLSAAPAKADASSKPVVNVNTPGLEGLKGQQGMAGGMGGGMGGMGGAHGAGGGDGKEHKTPDYLINNDHGFDLVGHALPVVSPEVIGELDKSEIKKLESNREKMTQETARQ
ncbi:hypothetical protein Srot_1838 [Segniliparus rotundus DSM 44985]|uniref:PPE family domain-containing protein n=1 Tax=Segniliparus rotundus (strain ATCC BAA-972 / CDC 1076 / CIP 108378 / DSM 44985 / JCM 13578) TaxID=640132 RepID=D6Z8L8_SEGRD|nr:hypothetical protein [Segniliparus rotundus]ADG98298.1 hypothetical protein Srot_1838 [Segniliparus rotundus DSM 44985]